MRSIRRSIVMVSGCLMLSACGGGGGNTPTAPSTPTGPTGLTIVRQQVTLTSNIVQLSWSGSSSSYRVVAGTGPSLQDGVQADVTGTSYTWTAPREANAYYVRVYATGGGQTSDPSNVVLAYTIDLRHVIDAMYFRAGPMADTPSNALANPSAAVWADGTRLRVPIAQEAGDATRVFAERFLNDYAAIGNGAITATAEMTSETFRELTLTQVADFTIPTRVLQTFCPSGALACAYYGPAPVGLNKSIVTMVSSSQGALRAMAHELGHAYGMGHVRVSGAVRAELNFMMNPSLVSDEMTETEKAAVAAAREGGIRPGWTRSQALAAGLVAPFTGASLHAATALVNPEGRTGDRCQVFDGPIR
jgi:hypothetical protein